MKKKFLSAVLLFVVFSTILVAHEGHKKKSSIKQPDTLTIVGNDTIAVNGKSTKVANIGIVERGSKHESIFETEEDDAKKITFGVVFEHLHNKLIHFPIALTVVSFLLLIVGYRDRKYFGAIKIIIPFASLITVAAVLTGQSQATPFEGTSTYSLIETHQLLGFGVLISLILWSLALYVQKLSKFVWLFGIATILFVLVAGLYGGVIAH